MIKIITTTIAFAIAAVGCTGIPVYQLPYSQDMEAMDRVVIFDSRPGNAKYFLEGNCENVVVKRIQLGDENFSESRLSYLERELSISLPKEMKEKKVELVSFDTFIVQVDGCASQNISTIERKKYKEDTTDHILTSITVIIEGEKYSGSYKNSSFGYLGDSIFDDSALDVEVIETVSQATKELVRSIRQR